FASLLDGIRSGAILDPAFRAIVERDLKDGQHRNPDENKDYFTTAYFHRPEELTAEITECGFTQCQTLAIEGTAWLLGDIKDQLEDPKRREILLDAIQKLEAEPSLLGASPHIMAVAQKP
ncbi:MAG: class I SAM-dependent methyltransferase, partial [Candidatus Latescibacteria bacterium]|nr:class I SAM-dependent methyltransferase [Candidatus Latescibacterota bacterium]